MLHFPSRLASHAASLLLALAALPVLGTTTAGLQASPLALLPEPTSIILGGSNEAPFVVLPTTRLYLPTLERPEYLELQGLLGDFRVDGGSAPTIDRIGTLPPSADQPALFFSFRGEPADSERYQLTITAQKVELVADTATGLLQGMRTLRQIVQQSGSVLPALTISDSPAFQFRGFYHDVSRGRVPKLETLKELVDQVARYKGNQFQLYVEHPFAFRFDERIAHDPDALTSADILALQEYCRDRRIDLVPSLQSFGHMAGVLTLPEYRKMAEVELEQSWEELTWHERMHGATLNFQDPEAIALLERMHAVYTTLHDSPYLNVCADETYDLGKGKNVELAQEIGTGQLYINNIIRLNELSKSHGKRMMFWGDIVKKHAELIPQIPKDTILLNWGYSAKTDFESTRLFAEAGLDFYVCPGTSGWRRALNDIDNADLNIRRYAATGKKYGAIGMLNTDWGDHGHFNPVAGSWHGLALGQAMAWNPEGPDPPEFDRRFTQLHFGEGTGGAAHAMRVQSHGEATWVALYLPFAEHEFLTKWHFTPEEAVLLRAGAREALPILEGYERNRIGDPRDVRELHLATLFNLQVAEKVELMYALRDAGDKPLDRKTRRRFLVLAAELERLLPEYRETWLIRHRISELGRIEEKLRERIAEARAIGKSGKLEPPTS